MERQDVGQSSKFGHQPASKNTRAQSYLQSQQMPYGFSGDLQALAREVLTLNRLMRDNDMPYVLQLNNSEYGPCIQVMDKATGLPCKQMAYDLLCRMADLPIHE